jgi:hypothetical protein
MGMDLTIERTHEIYTLEEISATYTPEEMDDAEDIYYGRLKKKYPNITKQIITEDRANSKLILFQDLYASSFIAGEGDLASAAYFTFFNNKLTGTGFEGNLKAELECLEKSGLEPKMEQLDDAFYELIDYVFGIYQDIEICLYIYSDSFYQWYLFNYNGGDFTWEQQDDPREP